MISNDKEMKPTTGKKPKSVPEIVALQLFNCYYILLFLLLLVFATTRYCEALLISVISTKPYHISCILPYSMGVASKSYCHVIRRHH